MEYTYESVNSIFCSVAVYVFSISEKHFLRFMVYPKTVDLEDKQAVK